MSDGDINEYLPSIINPRSIRKPFGTSTQNSTSRHSLSLRKFGKLQNVAKIHESDKENSLHFTDFINENHSLPSTVILHKLASVSNTLSFSALADIVTINNKPELPGSSFNDNHINENQNVSGDFLCTDKCESGGTSGKNKRANEELVVSVSFGITCTDKVNISTNNSNIKNICVSRKECDLTVDCDLTRDFPDSDSESQESMKQTILSTPSKRSAVSVNLELKRKKLSNANDCIENTKVLILNTNAIEKLSHVIVQPPNCKLVKKQRSRNSKFQNGASGFNIRSAFNNNGRKSLHSDNLKQKHIEGYFVKNRKLPHDERNESRAEIYCNDYPEMSRNSGADGAKVARTGRKVQISNRNGSHSPESVRLSPRRGYESPIQACHVKIQRTLSPKEKSESAGSRSPIRNIDSVQFALAESKFNKATTKNIPFFKIVAGTHFAVDAFSYGEIPSVQHYFLTHFHSDHYVGLKRNFNKTLICSKITADLCVSRLGVCQKYIRIINVDENIVVEDVHITAVEANHCPGAIMLVFTLPTGKSLLHTGDFRASPAMESYPIFWNINVHTVYLDTTYCNPRYDFPTQDQSMEMALNLLRQKKQALEKLGKNFSSVLIVCGTYTIGKEKFFLGIARRVGCSVWACHEKDKVLQTVEGRSFNQASPHTCQLHVVPMRDLTHEKLRCYLNNLNGAFSEVVAFKPSGWENGKNSSVEKDSVTIHGIPYSEHSSFSELIRFVKFLKPKQVVPTVDISGGIKAVQKFFPCPLVNKEDIQCQSKLTDYFRIQSRQQVPAVT